MAMGLQHFSGIAVAQASSARTRARCTRSELQPGGGTGGCGWAMTRLRSGRRG